MIFSGDTTGILSSVYAGLAPISASYSMSYISHVYVSSMLCISWLFHIMSQNSAELLLRNSIKFFSSSIIGLPSATRQPCAFVPSAK